MKYLKYHKQYKIENIQKDFTSSEMLTESFENDITWGGSLLGRLINSTIRKMKISYNYTKVNNLVKLVKEELNSMLNVLLSDDEKKKASTLTCRMLLDEIYKEATGEKEIKEKLKVLLGDNITDGLIDKCIAEIKNIEIENKSELIDKLNKFKDDLLKIKGDTSDSQEDQEENEESDDKSTGKSDISIFYSSTKSLLQSICKIHLDIKNNTVKFQKGSKENIDTFFDEKKYQQQRTNSISDINTKIALAKKAVTIFTNKGNKERVNFYNNEIKMYQKKLTNSQEKSVNQPNSKVSTETRPANFDVDADKRAKEERRRMSLVNNESILLEEIDSNLGEVESHAKSAWNKLVNAYNKSGISKYVSYLDSITSDSNGINKDGKKKIMEIGRQVIINYSSIGEPISFDQLISEQDSQYSTNDIAKSISLFGKVVLAYSEDMGLLASYGSSYKSNGDKAGGAGNHIKLFIESFNSINKVYPSIKKESVVINYSSFRLIKEDQSEEDDNTNIDDDNDSPSVEESGDSVKKSWFKFFKKGEEKKWVVTKEDEQFRDGIENSLEEKTLSDGSNNDHIIRIVNIFGKAYNLYACDYIPSGRPGGRISLKTMNEYEQIGSGKSEWSGDRSPGYGPWASKIVYNKWQDGITKLLEDKQLRRILANVKFVSDAESSTDTKQKAPGSGKTLFTFVNDLLNNDDGTFKKHRSILFKKYFGSEDTKSNSSLSEEFIGNRNIPISKDDEGKTDSPFFGNEGIGIKPGIASLGTELKNVMVKVISGDDIYIIYPYMSDKKNVLFRYQLSSKNNKKQSLVTDYLKYQVSESSDTKGAKFKTDLIDIPYFDDCDIFIGHVDLEDKSNKFSVGNTFNFKSISIKDASIKKYSNIKEESKKITKVEYLVVPVLDEKKKKQTLKKIVFKNVSISNRKDEKMGKDINDPLINELRKK